MLYKLALLLLIACCLTINAVAQIEKTVRGVPCSYDTCVSINIDNYRQIRQQFINRDSLISNLKSQVMLLGTQEQYYDSTVNNLYSQVRSFNNTISRKDSIILNLKGNIDELVKIKTTDPKRWYQRPSTWISGALGILIGVLASSGN